MFCVCERMVSKKGGKKSKGDNDGKLNEFNAKKRKEKTYAICKTIKHK